MRFVKSDHAPGGVCIISGELTRYVQSMQCFDSLKVPPHTSRYWGAGTLVTANVNRVFRNVMENPALEWAWLMGDDHIYNADILLNMLNRNVQAIVPLCLNRLLPIDPTVVITEDGKKRLKYLEDVPVGGLYKLKANESCGDAGLLIRRHVLEAIGDPWYENKKSGSLAAGGEDQDFIERIKALGVDVYVDTDNVIGHVAAVAFEPVAVDGHWETRMSVAGSPICNLGPQRR